MKHSVCNIVDAIFWMQHSGCKILDAIFWIQHSGCNIMDATIWMQHFGCNILDATIRMHQSKCNNLNATFELLAMCVVSMTTHCERGFIYPVDRNMGWDRQFSKSSREWEVNWTICVAVMSNQSEMGIIHHVHSNMKLNGQFLQFSWNFLEIEVVFSYYVYDNMNRNAFDLKVPTLWFDYWRSVKWS